MDGGNAAARGDKAGTGMLPVRFKTLHLKVGRDGFEGEASKGCKRDRSENSN
jgi:hypothetical protein